MIWHATNSDVAHCLFPCNDTWLDCPIESTLLWLALWLCMSTLHRKCADLPTFYCSWREAHSIYATLLTNYFPWDQCSSRSMIRTCPLLLSVRSTCIIAKKIITHIHFIMLLNEILSDFHKQNWVQHTSCTGHDRNFIKGKTLHSHPFHITIPLWLSHILNARNLLLCQSIPSSAFHVDAFTRHTQ